MHARWEEAKKRSRRTYWACVVVSLLLVALGFLFLTYPLLGGRAQAVLARALGMSVDEPSVLWAVLSMLFLGSGMALFIAASGIKDSDRTFDLVLAHSDALQEVLRLLAVIRESPLPAADTVRLRAEIEEYLARQLSTIEDRLRGEWRFTVSLIIASVLGVATLFVAVIAFIAR